MVIRMRHNKSQTRQRRSHHRAPVVTLTTDTQTGSVHQRHRVDMTTGMYRGKQILDPNKTKVVKKAEAKVSKKTK